MTITRDKEYNLSWLADLPHSCHFKGDICDDVRWSAMLLKAQNRRKTTHFITTCGRALTFTSTNWFINKRSLSGLQVRNALFRSMKRNILCKRTFALPLCIHRRNQCYLSYLGKWLSDEGHQNEMVKYL